MKPVGDTALVWLQALWHLGESSVREFWAGATRGYGVAATSESLVRAKEDEPLCRVR